MVGYWILGALIGMHIVLLICACIVDIDEE